MIKEKLSHLGLDSNRLARLRTESSRTLTPNVTMVPLLSLPGAVRSSLKQSRGSLTQQS
jgi:hypothetical protein